MSFAQPIWLLALATIPGVWWVHRRGVGAVPPRQREVAMWVRTVMVAAIVLALAGTALSLPDDRAATVFAVDVSDSVGLGSLDRAERFIASALASKPPESLAGIVAFGGEARVEASLTQDPLFTGVASEPDPTRTDVARALRLAAGLMPDGAHRRIVLISDGRQNTGEARLEADRLRREGIAVDVVEMSGTPGDDAAVLEVDAPSRVRIGDSFRVGAVLSATAEMRGKLSLWRDGEVTATRELTLKPGEQTISFPAKARAGGSVVYRVEFSPERDAVRQNNSATGLVLVAGRPRVVVVEGGPHEGANLARALRNRGFVVARRTPASFPSGEELAAIDAVALVDVDARALTEAQLATLRGFVRELGGGLVSIAGEASWSLGNYRGSALEDLLPLTSDVKDPRRRPSIAQLLAIDTSGSMATCHCNPQGSNMGDSGGVNKTDISRTAAAQAIAALSDQDEVGVLAFNTRSRFVIPLQQLPPEAVVADGLRSLQPRGGTAIPQALRQAVRALRRSKAALKHIVLFTDGFTDQRILPGLGAWVRRQGITLSVLATGEGSGHRLEAMAEAGGGRYYPGRNLYEIPQILMNEVVIATRNYVNEGVFYPKVTGASAATDGLAASPPLLGYIATAPKPSASVLMSVGRYDDPLLATWRTGLGDATAWASDAKGRWAARWISWDGFADFWSDVVREALPAATQPGFSTNAVIGNEGLEIRTDSVRPVLPGTTARARVVGPDGTATRIGLARAGLQGFVGVTSASSAGAYLVSVQLNDEGRSLYRETVGAVSSYSSEYRPGASDHSLLRSIAATTNGRVGIDPQQAFDVNGPAGRRRVEIWPRLTLLAALLLPVDVALRRVVLTSEDVSALRRWSSRSRGPAPAGPRPEGMTRLLEAKEWGRERSVARGEPTGTEPSESSAPD